ncbi:MAG: hypothetical protein QM718_15680 [Steroidobacteraceae bacterium]
MLRIAVFIVLAAILGLAGFTWFTLTWSYASGERAGYVQKLSHKGWVCKTWEGEMAMVNLPGTLTEKFDFTVRDDAVVRQINSLMGKRVTLRYNQHRWIPNSCFGETEYFVTSVTLQE